MSNAPQVRGKTSIRIPPKPKLIIFGLLCDLSLVIFIYAILVSVFHFSPLPTFQTVATTVLSFLAIYSSQILLFRRTIGSWIWGVRFENWKWVQTEALELKDHFQKGGLTALFTLAMSYSSYQLLASNPFLTKTRLWTLPPFAPSSSQSKDWSLLPFYFTLGAWPKTFQEKPAIYTLPYVKGPPLQFVEKVVVRLKMPDVKLLIEGPKTPTHHETAEKIKICFEPNWYFHPGCLSLREKTLKRHVEEMRAIHPKYWSIKWFEVNNPDLKRQNQPQGIYIESTNFKRSEIRYILITPGGTHQAIILRYRPNRDGTIAQMLLEQTIRSLQISRDLRPGRAYINQKLASTHLQKIVSMGDSPDAISKLLDVQASLISKVTVQPKSHEAYYHLGGTAFLLFQKVRQKGKDFLEETEWAAAAQPQVTSAYQYANDIDPNHKNTKRLKELTLKIENP